VPATSSDWNTRTQRQKAREGDKESESLNQRQRQGPITRLGMEAEAQQRSQECRDRARDDRVQRGWCAHLMVLNSAYISRPFPDLGHNRNTSSGIQKGTEAL
jgi:hypothetical protein